MHPYKKQAQSSHQAKTDRMCHGYADGGRANITPSIPNLPPPVPMPTVDTSWDKDKGFVKSMTPNEAAGKDPQGRVYK